MDPGGEVNRAIGWRLTEALPTVDFAHGHLVGGEQRPEHHGGRLGRGQDGLRLDPAPGLLVRPLDGVCNWYEDGGARFAEVSESSPHPRRHRPSRCALVLLCQK